MLGKMLIKTAAAVTLWGIMAGACCCEVPVAGKPKSPATQPAGQMTLAFAGLRGQYAAGENDFLLRLTNLTGEAFTAEPWYASPGPANATVYLRPHGKKDVSAYLPCWDADRSGAGEAARMDLARGAVTHFGNNVILNVAPGTYDIYAELKRHPSIRTKVRQIHVSGGPEVEEDGSRTCCP